MAVPSTGMPVPAAARVSPSPPDRFMAATSPATRTDRSSFAPIAAVMISVESLRNV